MPSTLDASMVATVTPEPTPPRVLTDPAVLRRIALVKLSSLGDVVCALPLLDSLREGLGPDVKIVWIVRNTFAPLLSGNPGLTLLSELRGRGAGDVLAFLRSLRTLPGIEYPFDVALDAQGLFLSGLIVRATGAPIRIGMDRNREGNALFLTHPVVPGKQRAHIVTKLLSYCDTLGIPRMPPRPQTYLAKGKRTEAQALLAQADAVERGPRVGMIVGASTPDKTWPRDNWVRLVGILKGKGITSVLLGGPGEKETAAQIVRQAKDRDVVDLTGRTPLPLLASTMALCDAVVGGDSGPTHLAVAVGTPVVGLYGVTDPARTGPQWGAAPSITLDFAERDAPPEARRPRHPTLTDALARIPPEAVAEAVEQLLRGGGDASAGMGG